jgi:hypothetical protein
MHEHFEAARAAGDLVSLSVVVGTLVQYLPAIAALFSIAWICIRAFYFFQDRRAGRIPTDSD